MDSIADTPVNAADAPASGAAATAGQGTIFELQLAALRHPALVHIDGWLPVASRLWVEWAMCATQEALEHTLDRPVSIDLLAADPGNAKEAIFAIGFEHPGAAGGGVILLDLPAARDVVEALETDV